MLFTSSRPIRLINGRNRALVCAVACADGTKCVAFADAFAPIIDVPVDETCPLLKDDTHVICNGMRVHDEGEAPPLNPDVQLVRCGQQLIVIASTDDSKMAFSLNWWLRTHDRADALVSCMSRLGCKTLSVPVSVGHYNRIIACITNAPVKQPKKPRLETWVADIDPLPFQKHQLRRATCLPGYKLFYLPETPVTVEAHVLPVPVAPVSPALVAAPVPLKPVRASLHVGDIPLDGTDEQLIDLYNDSIQTLHKTYPAAVFSKEACALCWRAGKNECVTCFQFVLCDECCTQLEGNCSQCLFEDQQAVADSCEAKRVT